MNKTFVNSIGLLFCGLSLGWMVGMSINPTIQHIITTLFAFLMTILGLIAGIDLTEKNRLGEYIKSINLVPIGIFFLFFGFGSAFGLYTRTNELLGMNPKIYMEKWKIPISNIGVLRDEMKADSIKRATLYSSDAKEFE
jgi:hypothetical protein